MLIFGGAYFHLTPGQILNWIRDCPGDSGTVGAYVLYS